MTFIIVGFTSDHLVTDWSASTVAFEVVLMMVPGLPAPNVYGPDPRRPAALDTRMRPWRSPSDEADDRTEP